MPRRLASGYPSSPFSLLHSGQCPDMSYSGGFSPGVPPLPIPNREVKPGRADGTAPQCGRVGRRLLSGEPSRKRGGFCFCVPFPSSSRSSGAVRGVDVSRSGSAGAAAICLRHAGAFFLVLLVRAKECLAPFWGGVRSVIDDALFTSLKLCE